MYTEIPRLMIAAPASGHGKTVITAGLLAAFSSALEVQAFKVGPDYIDPAYHTAATRRPARNLDSWMLPPASIPALFRRAAMGADLALIEGVMGLYDGADGRSGAGSSAEIARLLRVPIVLVIDAGRMARSIAACALGYRLFDPDVSLAGVIANRVGGARHVRWLAEALDQVGIPLLGAVPVDEAFLLPERHLGLVAASERADLEVFLERAAERIRQYLELDCLLAVARSAPPLSVPADDPFAALEPVCPAPTIAIARDKAFHFYYQDNLDMLRALGAKLVSFSPLHDPELPPQDRWTLRGGWVP